LERSRIKGSTAVIVILLITSQSLFISDSGGKGATKEVRSRDNQTWIVNGSGSGDYSSISSAIYYANDGDTIYVKAGIYSDSFEITKKINLVGAGHETTTIRGTHHYHKTVIHINAYGVKVTGFTIMSVESDGNGIDVFRSNNCSIMNNKIITHNKGISITSSWNVVLAANTIALNHFGDSDEKQLISIHESTYVSLNGNELRGNGISITGDILDYWNTHIIEDDNTVNKKKFIYWKARDGDTVPWDCGQIILVDCRNITVTAHEIENCHNAITLAYSSHNNLSYNDFSSNENSGIYLFNSKYNNINRNDCKNNDYGISLKNSHFNTVGNNSCSGRIHGINLRNSTINIIEYNTCNSSMDGIHLWSSDNNYIDNNTCHSNTENGIFLCFSNNVTVSKNRCNRNKCGIVLDKSGKARLQENTMEENGIDIVGDSLEHFNEFDIPKTNTVNGKPVYYWKNVKNDTVPMDGGQVILVNCSGIEVKGLEIKNATRGISLYFSKENLISNNTCTNNLMNGIDLFRSSGNSITGNSFHTLGDKNILYDNYFIYHFDLRFLLYHYHYEYYNYFSDYSAVNLVHSDNNEISNNKCNSDLYNAITVFNSEKNSIINNSYDKNPASGICLYNSSKSILKQNNCDFNAISGIYLFSSDDVEIFNNTCENNNKSGIELIGDYYSGSYCSNINLKNNTCRGNKNHGIYISTYENINLSGNMMWNNGLSVYGYNPENLFSYTIDTSNRVNGRRLYFWKGVKGGIVPGDAGQVILAGCSDITIRDLRISNATTGISVFYSSDIHITNNSCENNSVGGIRVIGSEQIKITSNNCNYNSCLDEFDYYTDTNGIEITGSSQCEVKNNSCINNQDYGIMTEWYCNHNSISDNNCHHNGRDGICVQNDGRNNHGNNGISNNSCNHNKANGISVDSSYNRITENDCRYNNEAGIEITWEDSNEIMNNKNYYNDEGIILMGAHYNIISGNDLSFNNDSGINCYESDDNTFYNNTCNSNDENGIYLSYESERNRISNNTFNFNNASGAYLKGDCNSITNNSFHLNNATGISIDGSSNGIIAFNDISKNGGYGIDIIINSYANTIHNNFMSENNHGGTQASDNGKWNNWYRYYRGNYWSEWTSPDVDGDRIVDIPYDLDGTADISDMFPLAVNTRTLMANAGNDVVVIAGSTVQFDGSHSNDDIKILNYTWTFTYDTKKIMLYGIDPEFTFEKTGTYEINLTVTDGDGNKDEDNVFVNVKGKENDGKMVIMGVAMCIVALIILSIIYRSRKKGNEDKSPDKGKPKKKADKTREKLPRFKIKGRSKEN